MLNFYYNSFYQFYNKKVKTFDIFSIDLEYIINLIKRFGGYLLYKLGKEKYYQESLHQFLYLSSINDELDFKIEREYGPGQEKVDILFETCRDKIGIEIKGPTRKSSFRSLPKQIIQYMDFCDYLVLVFFEVKDNVDIEKEMEKIMKGLNEEYQDRILYLVI